MKAKLLMTVIAIGGVNASASQLVCQGQNFKARFSNDQSQLQVVSKDASKKINSLLECRRAPAPRTTYPDQIVILAQCFEPQLRDAGYSAVLKTGGFAGMTTLELQQVSFVGSKKIDNLVCREP